MIARVSGRRSVMVVPAPGRPSTPIEPRSRSTLRFTTSMPTPRPEYSVTRSAVEKPGSRISRNSSPSGIDSRSR
jgi:hypothetical protein